MSIIIFLIFGTLATYHACHRYLDQFLPEKIIAFDLLVRLAFAIATNVLLNYVQSYEHGSFVLISFSVACLLALLNTLTCRAYWRRVHVDNDTKIEMARVLEHQ